MKIIIPIKKSRPARFTFKDIWRIIIDSWKIKWAMRRPFAGRFPFASSISHCQIELNDPLRFFVVDKEGGMNEQGVRLKQGTKLKRYFGARTIINPEIIGHGEATIKSREGCMSFPDGKIRKIKRWETVEVKYWTFFGKKQRKFYMYRASICQHEISHFDLVDIEQEYKHIKYKT